jgi:hypothetical protein
VSVTLPAGVEMEIAATGERLVGPVACNRAADTRENRRMNR